MNWINVKDELPPCNYEIEDGYVSQSVIVTDSGYHPSIGFGHLHEDGKWQIYKGEVDFMNPEEITHWMPLPKPPKEEKEEG